MGQFPAGAEWTETLNTPSVQECLTTMTNHPTWPCTAQECPASSSFAVEAACGEPWPWPHVNKTNKHKGGLSTCSRCAHVFFCQVAMLQSIDFTITAAICYECWNMLWVLEYVKNNKCLYVNLFLSYEHTLYSELRQCSCWALLSKCISCGCWWWCSWWWGGSLHVQSQFGSA